MYKRTKLKNGITLITAPVKGTHATTVLALFPVGSRYENEKLSGASHFVEHMLFKGTPTRPAAVDISKTLEQYGADYNAYTHKEYTGYYVKIDGAKQHVAFELLSDMIFNSVIDEAEVEKEKGAIVEELRMYQDNPLMDIDLLSDQIVFGDNQLGWDIGGSEKTVRGISRAELWKYYRENYSPKNMVLVVAGNINQKELKKNIAFFEKHKAPREALPGSFYKKNYNPFKWSTKALPLEKRVQVKQKPVDQAQVVISFPGIRSHHPDRYALGLLLNILGSGMSSRLFIEVRERRGLAYMVRSGSASFRDVGVAYVQAGLDPARLPEALKVIKHEIEKIAKEPVSKEELTKAKTNVAGRMALGMEDSSNQAEWYAKYQLFSPKILTHDQVLKKYQGVTREQIQRVAKKLLRWSEMRLAVIAPQSKEEILHLIP